MNKHKKEVLKSLRGILSDSTLTDKEARDEYLTEKNKIDIINK